MGIQSTVRAFAVPDLSGPQKAVLVALAHCRNEQSGQCNPSQATIAAMTSLDERTVRRAIDHLEQVGLLSRGTPRYVRRARLSDQYQLHLPTTGLSDRIGQADRRGHSDTSPDSVSAIDTGLSARQTVREQELKGAPPARRCPRHLDDIEAPPCGACRDARLEREAFDKAHAPKPASTPIPPRQLHVGMCTEPGHEGYPIDPRTGACDRCARDLQEIAS